MDERRRFSRRRPSDADITRTHNDAVRQQHIGEIPEPALSKLDNPESVLAEDAPDTGDTPAPEARSPERARVLAAARRVLSGRGRVRRAVAPSSTPVVDDDELIRRKIGPPKPHEETEPEPPPEPPEIQQRREWLRSRGVNPAGMVMHPVPQGGQGSQRVTFDGFVIEHY